MSMKKLKKCRICLVENVRMYVVADKNLHDIYEKLTDVPFVTEDSRPTLACVFCCSKLKQSYQLQRKCLEAEKLFAQMLNEDYETKPLINQDPLEISIVDECQIESIAIKEELPDVYEGQDDIIEPKEEYQSDELENLDTSCLDVTHVLPHRSESDLEDDVPLMKFKIEVEEEEEVSLNKPTTSETTKLVNLDISCLDVAHVPPHRSESDLEDDVPLMEFKIEVEEEQEVSVNKPTTSETTRATVAKKPKLDTRRTKLEDATAEGMREEKSDSKVIQITQKRTSKPGSYIKEPYKCDQRSSNPVKKIIQHTRTQLDESPYKCDVCQRSFGEKRYLNKHKRIHTGEKPYKCDWCQRSFIERSALTNHTRVHTGEKPFKCHICQCSFSQTGTLKTHIRQHTGEKAFKCNLCQRSFIQKVALTNHIRTHTGEKPFKCDICQCSFRQNSHLTTHIRQHTGEKPYTCDVCQRSFNQKFDLIKHNRIHTGEKPYKCDACQRSFSQKSSLTKHIRIHTEKPYKCDVCKRSYREKRTLTKHICINTGATVEKEPKLVTRRTKLEDTITARAAQRTKEKSDSKVNPTTQKRTSEPGTYFKEPYKCDQRSFNRVNKTIQDTQIGEKPYKCDICLRSYSQKCHLVKHIRVHSGAKPFKCELCERSFRQLCHLKSHILTHTGEKPYKCNVCQHNFSKKSYLAIHTRTHTGEKPYKCDLCQRSFSQKGHLTIHIRIHAGEKPYKCDVCDRNFNKKCDLTKHNRIHTGEKPFKCRLCEQSFRQNVHLTNHLRVHHTGEKLLKRSGA